MKLQKLKLTQLNNVELRQDEMEHLIGATSCGCACSGPSNTRDNGAANWERGIPYSKNGDNKVCGTWGQQSIWWKVNHNSSQDA